MLEDDGSPHRPSSPELPHVGNGRHFSWSILEDLDVEEGHRRASFGVHLFRARDGLLTPEEETELGRRVRAGTDATTEQRDDDARAAIEQLVLANLRLCIRPARARMWSGQEFDDVVQNGLHGLIRAAQKFDPEHGARFSTYAMFWIRQAMDRGGDKTARPIRLPSHVIDLQRRIEVAEQKGLINDRSTDEEIARNVRSDAEHVRVARAAMYEFIGPDEAESELRSERSLDQRSFEPDPDDPEAPDYQELVTADESPDATDALSALVASLMDRLTVREREVLLLHFGLEEVPHETLESIGEQFGLTRERVRQIRNSALDSIRRAVAVERARRTDFDAEMNLDAAAVRTLTSFDVTLHVPHALGGREPEGVPRVASSRPKDPTAENHRAVRSVLSDLRDATSTWSSELLFEPDPEYRRHPRIAERIGPLTEQEPFDRSALVEALSELVDDIGPDTIGEDLLDMARSTVRAALDVTPPDADALGHLLRLVRFLGCSTDPVGFRIALHASRLGTLALQAGSRVAGTWHYDENDPAHAELRQEMHRHGEALGLEWNSTFDDDLDLVIAQSLEHRSAKTYSAVLADIPICDIKTFLDHRAGRRLTVRRSPFPIPQTFVCRGCHTVESRSRAAGASFPTHCRNCANR